jgi:hypothetical protein
MKNYQALISLCYQPQPPASVDNTNLQLDNSSHHAQPHSTIVNNYNVYSSATAPMQWQISSIFKFTFTQTSIK